MSHNLNSLLESGVLTGSRAFNCSTAISDWDIVILRSNQPELKICGFNIIYRFYF